MSSPPPLESSRHLLIIALRRPSLASYHHRIGHHLVRISDCLSMSYILAQLHQEVEEYWVFQSIVRYPVFVTGKQVKQGLFARMDKRCSK